MIAPRLALAFTAAALLAQAQARREYPGRQGSIVSDAPPAVAKLWVERLDRFCSVFEKFYTGFLSFVRPQDGSSDGVFATFDEYSEFKSRDNKDLNAMAYFSPSLNSIVMYHDENDPWLAHTLFHETQHQYLARYTSSAPRWVNEGLSEYFEGWSLGDDGKLESRPNLYDLLVLQGELEKKKGFPLEKLVRLPPAAFNDFAKDHPDRQPYLHYATSWGLVYWFLELAEPSDREIFRGYLRDLNAKGAKAERAELAILDWDAFETKWKESILRLDAACKTRDEYLQMAAGHRGNGDFADAIAAYRKALALDPKTPGVHFWLGWCLYGAGATEEAKKELELARAEDKEDARAPYLLARIAAGIDRAGSKPDPKAAIALAKEAFDRSGRTNANYLARRRLRSSAATSAPRSRR